MKQVFAGNPLSGKTALISGGTSGINLEIARRLVELDANVTVFGRDANKSDAAAAELRRHAATPEAVMGQSADVRDFAAVKGVVDACVARFGGLDIVVAGAAGNFVAPAIGMSTNGFRTVVEIDLIGTFNVMRAAFDSLRTGASLIAISAEQAEVPHPLQAHVCAAKAGVNMLVKVLAMEWGPAGIRVNAIVPGPTEGTEGMARLTPTEQARKTLEGRIPLRRYGTKTEVADLALFLCSDAARYITGAILPCDGGASLVGSANATYDCLTPQARSES